MTRYGASPEDWTRFAETLGLLPDLLPCISDPSIKPSPGSRLTQFGKVPSLINGDGTGHGIAGWTQHVATADDVQRWSRDDRHGICVIARRLRALDVDVSDTAASEGIRVAFAAATGCTGFPVRSRSNSGKLLIPFWADGVLPKHVLPVEGGTVEVLGEAQQWVAVGTHPSGARYEWSEGTIPTLTREQFDRLWSTLSLIHGTGEPRVARERRTGAGGASREGLDEVGQWLVDNWEIYDVEDGRVYVECPFAASHTTEDTGTGTAYFSAGSGGYSQGHWRCLHAHCEGRNDSEFLDAVGYSVGQFADLGANEVVVENGAGSGNAAVDLVPRPRRELRLVRKGDKIEPTADNLTKMCREPTWIYKVLAYDAFRDETVWAPDDAVPGDEQWRPFGDDDTLDVLIEMERRGLKAMPSPTLLRSCIHRAAVARTIDTAREWLSRLRWDGVPRVEQFAVIGWGWEASPYAAAVSRYVWTALAGRVLEPGCQADMAPVLVGPQGAGKTRAIKAMAPAAEMYSTIPLDAHDADTARLLRGKMVGELEELRGLNTKAIESIKAWITRTHENWIPKFKEYQAGFARRVVLFGTTNDEEFLNDPTGERRFLPGRCGTLDVEWITRWREQLWAEGAALFMLGGVDWSGAETLARAEHGQFKVTDAWEQPVARWLAEPQIDGTTPTQAGWVQVDEALAGAVGVPVGQHDRAKVMRMGKVLSGLGWNRERVYDASGKRVWAFVFKGVVES